ncbi:MAG: PTS transporter subunit EIIC [Turicibacter sp.]|nr:PTS transporter subunit EIIC [Turicibacter sp.]
MTATMERVFLPIAHKISSQRHLSAIKDGFIATMPLALVGAIATLLNNVFFGSTTIIGELLNRMSWYANSVQPIIDSSLSPVMSQLWWGTIAVGVLFSTFTIAYNLAKNLGEDGMIPGIIAVASYMVLTPQSAEFDGTSFWGAISWTSFNSQAVFAGLLTALLATELYCWVKRKGWVIKMPDSVPPSVSKAFSAVIPAGITLTIVAIVSVIFLEGVGTPLQLWINEVLQAPLVRLGQSPLTLILLTILAQLLWFFGLHGMNITEPALTLMYAPTLNENMELVNQGLEPIHAITRNFVDVYGMHGGSGSTLALIIAIFIFSKKPSYRTLAKMSLAPGIFQINEPIIFGLPMVMNVILVIPFILVPTINLTLAWFFTAVVPFAGKIYIAVPWTTPPVISAFLATGGDIPATILAAITFVIAIVIYAPFVIMANKEAE